MTPRVLRGMFTRASKATSLSGDWARSKKVFTAEVDGVACSFRFTFDLIIVAAGEQRQVKGDCTAQCLAVDGRPMPSCIGWIHFVGRDDAFEDPSPLFQLAFSESTARLRRLPAFVAAVEQSVLGQCAPHPVGHTPMKPRRL